jgi:hypothetical protein
MVSGQALTVFLRHILARRNAKQTFIRAAKTPHGFGTLCAIFGQTLLKI